MTTDSRVMLQWRDLQSYITTAAPTCSHAHPESVGIILVTVRRFLTKHRRWGLGIAERKGQNCVCSHGRIFGPVWQSYLNIKGTREEWRICDRYWITYLRKGFGGTFCHMSKPYTHSSVGEILTVIKGGEYVWVTQKWKQYYRTGDTPGCQNERIQCHC